MFELISWKIKSKLNITSFIYKYNKKKHLATQKAAVKSQWMLCRLHIDAKFSLKLHVENKQLPILFKLTDAFMVTHRFQIKSKHKTFTASKVNKILSVGSEESAAQYER